MRSKRVVWSEEGQRRTLKSAKDWRVVVEVLLWRVVAGSETDLPPLAVFAERVDTIHGSLLEVEVGARRRRRHRGNADVERVRETVCGRGTDGNDSAAIRHRRPPESGERIAAHRVGVVDTGREGVPAERTR